MTDSGTNLLHVVVNGHVVGDIQRSGKRRIRLRYAESPDHRFTPLSVAMPGPTGRYREDTLVPWLEGLLPDRPETLRQWRRRFGIAADTSVFTLLTHVGEDVAGAAQFVRDDRLDHVLNEPGAVTALDGPSIADMLRRAKADMPVGTDSSVGKFSLAGAQAKVALHRTEQGWSDPDGSVPSTHILKPAIPGMPDQDIIEAVTMRTAAELRLPVAVCAVEEFDDERAIVVERFDRFQGPEGTWQRIHQEDMCQALGLWPHQKYESQGGPGATRVADLISRTSQRADEDNRRFAQALVFNWLMCGTDAHARNYSLLLSGGSVRLAPLYDLNSHLAYTNGVGSDLSMSIGGTFRAAQLTLDRWHAAADTLAVAPDWLMSEIERQAAGLLDAVSTASRTPDIARFESRSVDRLLANTDQWLTERLRLRT